MTTENKTLTQETVATKGQLTFDDKVIQKIVGYAIENVSGLLGVDGGCGIVRFELKLLNRWWKCWEWHFCWRFFVM